ncbi:MAG TPA: prepilin peptidase [Longimicrobiales bacterium]
MSSVNTALFLFLVAAAGWLDLRTGRIPNIVTLTGLAAALALRALLDPSLLGPGLAGAALGLGVSLPLFALGGLGGGDVKLLAAVGAFLGPGKLGTALLAAGLAGGAMALAVAVWRGALAATLAGTGNLLLRWLTLGRAGQRRTLGAPGAVTVPYGVAIAAGAVAGWILPPLGGG